MNIDLGGPLNPRVLGVARALDLVDGDVAITEAEVRTAKDPSTLPVDVVGDVEFAYSNAHGHEARVFRVGDDARLVLDWWGGPDLSIAAFAPTVERADQVLQAVVRFVGVLAAPPEQVGVTFWAWNERFGAQPRWRGLDAAPWGAIAANYPQQTQRDLARIMQWETAPPDAGQLLLLYGPPGTGKTHAIRALAQEWRDWCDVAYIVDPDRFFGSADYMLSVLLDDHEDRWSLVVVEDTDELIASDAKARSGQSMSRLLNVCDGFVGQGLRVLVLLTTNEPIEGLAPAVTRPGRCAAQIEAGLFPAGEATAWLAERGVPDADIGDEQSLAALYHRLARYEEVDALAASLGR